MFIRILYCPQSWLNMKKSHIVECVILTNTKSKHINIVVNFSYHLVSAPYCKIQT